MGASLHSEVRSAYPDAVGIRAIGQWFPEIRQLPIGPYAGVVEQMWGENDQEGNRQNDDASPTVYGHRSMINPAATMLKRLTRATVVAPHTLAVALCWLSGLHSVTYSASES